MAVVTGLPIGVSVVCPGPVRDTRIADGARNRPGGDPRPLAPAAPRPHPPPVAKDPAEIADAIVSAITEDRFWVLTHPDFGGLIRERAAAMVAGRDPSVPRLP